MAELTLAYMAAGVFFGLYFVIKGCSVLDATAAVSGIAVRLLWFPAAVVLWPVLVAKIVKSSAQHK